MQQTNDDRRQKETKTKIQKQQNQEEAVTTEAFSSLCWPAVIRVLYKTKLTVDIDYQQHFGKVETKRKQIVHSELQ